MTMGDSGLTPRLIFGSALWEALGRKPEDFDSYVADHGWEAVADELLRTVAIHQAHVLATDAIGPGGEDGR